MITVVKIPLTPEGGTKMPLEFVSLPLGDLPPGRQGYPKDSEGIEGGIETT
ncbi:MAG: hypothetical protein ACI9Y7_001543 [Dokdonia sp.]|jgi:hypothetical protein